MRKEIISLKILSNAKIILALIIFSLGINKSFAQIEKGVTFNIGLGTINSRHLNQQMLQLKKDDAYVTNANAHGGKGVNIGIGGFITYSFNDRMSVLSDISFNYHNSSIFLNYTRDSLDGNRSGTHDRISSGGNLKLFYINVPVLFRYRLFENKKYFLLSGLTFNYNSRPVFKAEESEVYNVYANGIITDTKINPVSQKVVMDKYNHINGFLTLGVEKGFRGDLKNLSIIFRCNVPITKSQMYTTNGAFYNSSIMNRALTAQGKSELESNSSHALNDFRRTSYVVTFLYKLKKKS